MRAWWLALVVVLPTAQGLAAEVSGPAEPLRPMVPVSVELRVSVDCQLVPQVDPHVVVETRAEGLVITGPTRLPVPDCLGRDQVIVVQSYNVTGGLDVPGEHPIRTEFIVHLEGDDQEEVATWETQMAFVGEFSAEVKHPYKKAAPQKHVVFEVLIQSHANARSIFSFTAEAPREGDLVAPVATILEEGRANKTVEVLYATPFQNGPNYALEDLVIHIHQKSAKSGAPGGEARVDLKAETEGLYVPAGLPLAALAAGLVLRRR